MGTGMIFSRVHHAFKAGYKFTCVEHQLLTPKRYLKFNITNETRWGKFPRIGSLILQKGEKRNTCLIMIDEQINIRIR